jgi:hypothetical protein
MVTAMDSAAVGLRDASLADRYKYRLVPRNRT